MSNPVFGKNRLKLGTFCTNGKGASQTLVPEAPRVSWPHAVKLAQIADKAGYEAVVPYVRWKGYVKGKPNHVTGEVLDPYTFAAGIAQATQNIGVFVTTQATAIHPIVAAKQLATIDIISNGRLGVNVVGGWNQPELEMFGAPIKEHDLRYDHLAEWLKIVERLWTDENEFDHEGEFFRIVQGISNPRPIQKPHPPIMNAGGSARGKDFACEHADMCFVILTSEDPEKIRTDISDYKQYAQDKFGREVKVWTHTYVVQRDTQKEADDYLRYFAVENQDRESVDAWIAGQAAQTQILKPEALEAFRTRWAAGAGGFPLVGTANHIADQLKMLSNCGLDGVLLTWVDYEDGMNRFNADVLPQLEAGGLREPVKQTLEAAE